MSEFAGEQIFLLSQCTQCIHTDWAQEYLDWLKSMLEILCKFYEVNLSQPWQQMCSGVLCNTPCPPFNQKLQFYTFKTILGSCLETLIISCICTPVLNNSKITRSVLKILLVRAKLQDQVSSLLLPTRKQGVVLHSQTWGICNKNAIQQFLWKQISGNSGKFQNFQFHVTTAT
jgi:hypothetical protein